MTLVADDPQTTSTQQHEGPGRLSGRTEEARRLQTLSTDAKRRKKLLGAGLTDLTIPELGERALRTVLIGVNIGTIEVTPGQVANVIRALHEVAKGDQDVSASDRSMLVAELVTLLHRARGTTEDAEVVETPAITVSGETGVL